jgi:hypothetical protein
MADPNSPYLTTEEAAAYVRRSAVSLERDRVRGDGPVYSRLGKLVVYTKVDLDQWVRERRHRSTSEYARASDRSLGVVECPPTAAEG